MYKYYIQSHHSSPYLYLPISRPTKNCWLALRMVVTDILIWSIHVITSSNLVWNHRIAFRRKEYKSFHACFITHLFSRLDHLGELLATFVQRPQILIGTEHNMQRLEPPNSDFFNRRILPDILLDYVRQRTRSYRLPWWFVPLEPLTAKHRTRLILLFSCCGLGTGFLTFKTLRGHDHRSSPIAEKQRNQALHSRPSPVERSPQPSTPLGNL